MALPVDGKPVFRRRVLGYHRGQVDRVIDVAHTELSRVRAERDELQQSAASVQRIGAEVAEVLGALADRVDEIETNAHEEAGGILAAARTEAARLVDEAEEQASALRAQAAAALSEAEDRARCILERAVGEAEQRAAAVARHRDDALAALRGAADRLAALTDTVGDISAADVAGLRALPADSAAADRAAADCDDVVVDLEGAGGYPDVLHLLAGWASNGATRDG